MLSNALKSFLSSFSKHPPAPQNIPVPEPLPVQLDPFPANEPEAIVGPPAKPNNAEKHDDYSKVVTKLNGNWRVIVCRHGIQWILQSRKGTYQGKPAWRGRKFDRSKGGILRSVAEHAGPITDEARQKLDQLPEWADR